jgi:hypothetical protein
MVKRGRPRKDVKRYVLTQTMHLGHIRETIAAGAVIEHDEADNKLRIDGRVFENTKDIPILKKHGWIVAYSKESQKEVMKDVAEKEDAKAPEPENSTRNTEKQGMKVVQSDEDLIESIDISHTKPQKPEEKDKDAPMEVIRGDETAEERLERLQTTVPNMPVVEDDSLGVDNSKAPSLNEGQVKSPPSEDGESESAPVSEDAGEEAASADDGQTDSQPKPPKKAKRAKRVAVEQ